MNQSENRLTTGSSFHRRRQNELSGFLINEMGLEPPLAHTLLALHKPATLRNTLDLFLVDDQGLANHFFIPQTQPGVDQADKCRVCEGKASEHLQGDLEMVADLLSQEVEQSEASSEEREQKLSQSSKKPCEICCLEVIEEDLVQIRGTAHDICLQCMQSYLKEEIGSMRVEQLACPHCNAPLPNDLIRELIDLPTYNKYQQFRRNVQIRKNPNLKWCPNSKCSVVIKTNPKKKTSKCPKCATMICNRCNREAHPKSSCEGAFKKEIKTWQNASDIQKCKQCHGLVEKIAGCNHMTCYVCHFEWCWLCGSEYSQAHFSPLNPFGCPGLQDRPRDDWTKCRIIMLRVGILLLLVIGFPVLLPVAMVFVGPALTIQAIYNYWHPVGCLKQAAFMLLSIVVGLITDPLIWIGCVFYFIPKGVTKLCEWYAQRRAEEQRRDHFLQERLLAEEVFQEPGAG